MADKYSTITQHQPLRVPEGWDKQERSLIIQLEEIFDDIYRKFGRLGMNDMSKGFRMIVDGKYDIVSGIVIDEDGIDISGAKHVNIESGCELNVKSGGNMKISSGGTLDINTNNFIVDSTNRKMVSNDMTFDQNGFTKNVGSSKKFIVGNYTAKDNNTIAGVFCDASSTLGNIRLLTSPSDNTKSTELVLETYINPYNSTDMARLYFSGTWLVPVFGKKDRPIVHIMGQNYHGRLSGMSPPYDCGLNLCVDPEYDPDYVGQTGYPTAPSKFLRLSYSATDNWIQLTSSYGNLHFRSPVNFDSTSTYVKTLVYDALVQNSSREIKHDIQDMESPGEKLDALRPVTFVYDEDPDEKKRAGLIYEETETVMPEICTGDEENKAINYVELIPVLLKEIQELRARVAALEGGQQNG